MNGRCSFYGKFEGNILIVGQTGCGKTTFIQKLAIKTKYLETLKKYIRPQKYSFLHKEKKTFFPVFKRLDFKYPETIDEFDMHLTFFQKKRNVDNDIDILMGEKNVFDELHVMDDALGLADKFEEFSIF